MNMYQEIQENEKLWALYTSDNFFRRSAMEAVRNGFTYTQFLEAYSVMSTEMRVKEFERTLNGMMSRTRAPSLILPKEDYAKFDELMKDAVWNG